MDFIRIITLIAGISTIHLTNGKHANVTNYDSGPGLYYERVGEASIYIQDFNIITYYDLQRYFLNRDRVEEYISKVEKLCKQISHHYCPNYVQLVKDTHKTLEHKHNLIGDILQIRHSSTRKKRFWGELASTVVSEIFGVIKDSQKTKAVTEEIQKYREEVEHLKTMLMHQMYIYENFQKDVNNKFDQLSSEITELTNTLENFRHTRLEQQRNQRMTNLLSFTNNLIHLFTAEQSDLLDCLILARQGTIHPIIMSPSMMKDKLLQARNTLENNDILKEALWKAANNSNIMFNMIKPVIYVENMTMIFDFDIPLITESFYDIYKLTSAPVSISENVYAYVYPESPYLLQEKRNERHFFFDVYEFEKCSVAGDKQYVCKREKPLRLKELTCEHMLISSGEAMPENCDVRLIKIDETLFIELEREGSWLFTAPKSERITSYCDHQIMFTNILGTGIVNVDVSCSNTQSDTIFLRDFSTNNMNLTQNFEVLTPRGNLKKYLEDVDLTHLKATMNIKVLSRAETIKLKDLGVSLSAIHMRNQFYTRDSAVGHNVLLYLLSVVCCGLIIANVYMFKTFKKY